MKSMIINNLYIFDTSDKKAKKIKFTDGVNILTSSSDDGNDLGKSMVLKSIYHTLGADCYFGDKWDNDTKIYYVEFSIDGVKRSVYRNKNLFKLFDEKRKCYFSTVNRIDLSNELSKIYDFKVLLPNRKENQLVMTPPAYSYLLNYIDQDHMMGTQFKSFDSLGQFANYKENAIYNHFGVFNEKYFYLMKEMEELKYHEQDLIKEKNLLEQMLLKIKRYLDGLDAPIHIDSLNKELNQYSDEYNVIVNSLSKIKNNLINLRNDKYDLEISLNELSKISSSEYKEILSLKTDTCPTCQQNISKDELFVKKNNMFEDGILLRDELRSLILEVERKLTLKEDKYKELLVKRDVFEEKIKYQQKNVSSVLKHIGYEETKDNLLNELGTVDMSITTNGVKQKKCKSELKQFSDIKKLTNEMYYKSLIKARDYFGLEEVNSKKFELVKTNFTAGGSNKPIATIMWYLTLLNVKYYFNDEILRFPIVLDSPNNVESDLEKKSKLINYIFDEVDKNSQVIVSILGFNVNDYSERKIENVITLKNEKYSLLNEDDYNKHKNILQVL